MRKLVFLMLSVAAAPAFAADLPAEKGVPAYAPPPPPAFSWNGFYVGANVGYIQSNIGESTYGTDDASEGQIKGGTVPPSQFWQHGGATAGGQVGFNYEFPTGAGWGIVAGIEADFAYTDASGGGEVDDEDTGTSNIYHSTLQNLGTARARIGVAFDRALIYATGGFAYGRAQYSHDYLDQAGDPIWGGGASSERTGWAVGGGVEYALAIPSQAPGAWTIKGEFLHYDLGEGTANIPFVIAPAPIGPFVDQYHLYGNLFRVGVNYKFDLFEPPAPVVAKY